MAAVGLSTAWWTFRSQGRHAVSVEQVKAFDQPADCNVHACAAALAPSGFTRLGAAIRHAANAGDYADCDARMALLEARNRQIGCLCLSVGIEHDDTRLRNTFGAQDYLRFGSWDALRGDLAPLICTAIRVRRPL